MSARRDRCATEKCTENRDGTEDGGRRGSSQPDTFDNIFPSPGGPKEGGWHRVGSEGMANVVHIGAAALLGGAFLLRKVQQKRREEDDWKQAEAEEVRLRTAACRLSSGGG